MKKVEDYVEFLMDEHQIHRLPRSMRLQMKMVLENHFEDESGMWIRRQLDLIHKHVDGDKELLAGLINSLRTDWRGRTPDLN